MDDAKPEQGQPHACNGMYTTSYEQCDYRPGYAPVINRLQIEQFVGFMLIIAVVHVALSVWMLAASSIKMW
jgi:hypothetical protein